MGHASTGNKGKFKNQEDWGFNLEAGRARLMGNNLETCNGSNNSFSILQHVDDEALPSVVAHCYVNTMP
jgi:hypothetical protein